MLLQQAVGVLLGVFAMLMYSLYMVPRKQLSISQQTYTRWMGLGTLIGTFVIALVFKGIKQVTPAQCLIMLLTGVFWSTGTLGYTIGVKYIGLSRSTPIKNLAAMLGTFSGILVFHEFTINRPLPMFLAIAGSVAIVISTTLLGRVQAPKDSPDRKTTPKRLLVGILCSLWAAICFSAYTIPMKKMYGEGVTPTTFLFYMGQGCFIGMLLISLVGDRTTERSLTWRDRHMAQLSGFMWAVGSLCANYAVKLVGIAVAWPLTKSTALAVLYGVFVLREVDTVRHRKDLQIGLALSIIGIILLPLALGHN